jgi:hypothetical protein
LGFAVPAAIGPDFERRWETCARVMGKWERRQRMATISEGEIEIFDEPLAGDAGSPEAGLECVVEGALAIKAAPALDETEPRRPRLAAPATSATAVTREQRRSRRKREIRARTISVKRMTKREIEIGRMLYPESDYWKPKTRNECVDGPRPCPFVSCQHHLYLDVSARTGAIKLNFPDLEVWEMNETCALDVADRGGTTLEDVGAIMNLTRERIRQVEVKALAKLEALKDMMALRDYIDEGPVGKRRLPVLANVVDDDEDEDLDLDDDDDDDEDDEHTGESDMPSSYEDSSVDFDGAD